MDGELGWIAGVWIIPALPLAAFLINGLLGARLLGKLTGHIASVAVGASAVLAIRVLFDVLRLGGEHQTVTLYEWIGVGDFHAPVAALVDPLSAVMLVVVTSVSFLVHVYSIGYMSHDHGIHRFFTWLPLFVFAMLILVLADNYVLMFVGWEGVGLCSYLLIGFWFERPEPYVAAKKAFVMNRIGDWGFTVGMILTFLAFGSVTFLEVFEGLHDPEHAPAAGILTLISLAFFLGATGKSAQLPLYSWLPDAMEGPTPVSALIHAATMVTAGVYLVARSTPLFAAAGPEALLVVGVVGALTAIFAATIALVQFDIKRVMAYSTVSQLGYMFLALGVGAPIAAIFHLVTHAFFKALLFLGSGSVIHATEEQDMRRMGGLRRKLPVTYWTMLIAGGALAALPPLAGFWSKDEIVGAAFLNGYPLLWAVGLVTGALTAFYVTRAMYLTFHGEPRDDHLYEHAHESPPVMTVPLVLLAVGSVLAGFIGVPPEAGFIHQFLEPSVHVEGVEHHAPDYGLVALLAGASVLAGLAGIGMGVAMYARRRPDPAAVTRAAGPVYTLLANKYYVDELYDRRLVDAGKALFGAGWAFDVHIIDGLVDRLGWLMALVGSGLRRAQTGIVGNYALSVVAGLIVLIVVYGGYAVGILTR
jgi:NADH-quinone oxidoreductase subunit L